MKRTTAIAALVALAAILFPTLAGATEYRKVDGFVEDSTRPGLRIPRAFDLDDREGNPIYTSANVGAVAGTGVSVVEHGTTYFHTTVFTFTAVDVATVDATTNGAHGGMKIYDFPSAAVMLLGATSDLTTTAGAGGIADTAAVVCSLGSVTVANTNDTLTSTEADFMPSTSGTLSGGIGACDGQTTTALLAIFDGTATATDLYLNFAMPDAGSSADDTLTVAGTITLTWAHLGDN